MSDLVNPQSLFFKDINIDKKDVNQVVPLCQLRLVDGNVSAVSSLFDELSETDRKQALKSLLYWTNSRPYEVNQIFDALQTLIDATKQADLLDELVHIMYETNSGGYDNHVNGDVIATLIFHADKKRLYEILDSAEKQNILDNFLSAAACIADVSVEPYETFSGSSAPDPITFYTQAALKMAALGGHQDIVDHLLEKMSISGITPEEQYKKILSSSPSKKPLIKHTSKSNLTTNDDDLYTRLLALTDCLDRSETNEGYGKKWAAILSKLFDNEQEAEQFLIKRLAYMSAHKDDPMIWRHTRESLGCADGLWREDFSPMDLINQDRFRLALDIKIPEDNFDHNNWKKLLLNYPESANFLAQAPAIETFIAEKGVDFPQTILELQEIVLDFSIKNANLEHTEIARELHERFNDHHLKTINTTELIHKNNLGNKSSLTRQCSINIADPKENIPLLENFAHLGVLGNTLVESQIFNRQTIEYAEVPRIKMFLNSDSTDAIFVAGLLQAMEMQKPSGHYTSENFDIMYHYNNIEENQQLEVAKQVALNILSNDKNNYKSLFNTNKSYDDLQHDILSAESWDDLPDHETNHRFISKDFPYPNTNFYLPCYTTNDVRGKSTISKDKIAHSFSLTDEIMANAISMIKQNGMAKIPNRVELIDTPKIASGGFSI